MKILLFLFGWIIKPKIELTCLDEIMMCIEIFAFVFLIAFAYDKYTRYRKWKNQNF